MPPTSELSDHLFRRESGRIIAALIRIFGVHNLALAEDVVQEAFCRAIEVWQLRGVPDNPAAWLMTTAKRRAIDVVRRDRRAQRFAPAIGRLVDGEAALIPLVDDAFAPQAIHDEQLRMMLSCCQPSLPEPVQLALVLNILCGFGSGEIAGALLCSRAAVEKRIARGKRVLAAATGLFELGDAAFAQRLATLQRALYLLFNEGYHCTSGGSAKAAVRGELCEEAMRLVGLLREYPPAATPATHALAALMALHAARLPARLDDAGELNPLADQDRARWDARLVGEGLALFERSATGGELTAYHVEAAIAAVHAAAPSVERTDWPAIVELYDRLMAIAGSPVVALNRAVAIGQRDGAAAGLSAVHAIADRDRLSAYPFYPAAIGELELARGDPAAAERQFHAAHALARNPTEQRFLARRAQAAADAVKRCYVDRENRRG